MTVTAHLTKYKQVKLDTIYQHWVHKI